MRLFSLGQVIVLVRGLPGCGKTTIARRAFNNAPKFAADNFFYKMVEGHRQYVFDPTQLGAAHQECQTKTRVMLDTGSPTVVVHNTFSTRWEMEPYLRMAGGTTVVSVLDLFDGGCTDEELFKRNSHGVPLETITAMRARWEHDWKVGNPLPPWERPKEEE